MGIGKSVKATAIVKLNEQENKSGKELCWID